MLVLLLTVDCLRHDYINKSNNCTPAITDLCKSSHLFANAYATGGRTSYSFPSILGSYYRISQPSNKFPVSKPTVAKVFKDAGFRTIGIQAANPYLSSFFNYDVGFEEFEDFLLTSQDVKKASLSEFSKGTRRTFTNKIIEYAKAILFDELPGEHASKMVSCAIEKLKSTKKGKDIFLWTHLMDTHASFKPPRKFLDTQPSKVTYWKNLVRAKKVYSHKRASKKDLANIKELYLACIRYVDDNFNRLFAWLKEEGWYDDAIIIVTSDHGESFMEHGYFEHPPENLYNEQVQVPLIIKLPGQQEHKTHAERVSNIDLFPSILGSLDIQVPSDFCGKANLLSAHNQERPVFACGGTGDTPWKRTACIDGNWKLISECKPSGIEALELYDLAEDPQEKTNQLDKVGEKVSELTRLTHDFLATFKVQEAKEEKTDNEVIKRRLKALGYID